MFMEQEEAGFFFYLAYGWIQKQLQEKAQVCWVFHMFILHWNAPEQYAVPFQCSKKIPGLLVRQAIYFCNSLIMVNLLPQASCNPFLKTISYSSIIHNAVPHNNRLITALLLKMQNIFDMLHNGTSQTAHKPVQRIPPSFPCFAVIFLSILSCRVQFRLRCLWARGHVNHLWLHTNIK